MCWRHLRCCLRRLAGMTAAIVTPVRILTTGNSTIANRLNAQFRERAPMILCLLVAQ